MTEAIGERSNGRSPAALFTRGAEGVILLPTPVSPRRKPRPIDTGLWNVDPGLRRGDNRELAVVGETVAQVTAGEWLPPARPPAC
jgi:hypothetical protein